MTRAAWTREELRGHRLVFLVDVTFGGRLHRLSTEAVVVTDADGTALQYAGTLDAITWSRSLDLFSLQPEPESIIVSGVVAVDVAALVKQGHHLEGAVVQVSQVRVEARPRYSAALAADAYASRRVCLTGRAADAEYGVAGEQGAYVRFSAERNLYDSTAQVPLSICRVNDDTWKVSGRLDESDVDTYYPIPIGYPGRDDASPLGWHAGAIGTWINKQNQYQVLCVGLGRIDASTVWLSTDGNPNGMEATVRYTYTNNSTTHDARDKLGTLIAVIDYNQDDYGDSDPANPNYLGDSFCPSVDSSDQVFVGFPSGSGGTLWRGRVLRDAGDVLEWAMELARIPVDLQGFAAARPQIAWCKVDTVIDDAVNPVEWATQYLLPLLPVSLLMTDAGITPWVWNPNTTRADCVCHLDGDADPTIDFADTVKCDATQVTNYFELQYGYNQRAQRYQHTARLGPERIETTSQARGILKTTDFGSAGVKRITVYARATGPTGNGIVVTLTDTGALSVTDGTASVAITWDSTADDSAAIASAINAGSALIEAETSDDSGDVWLGTTTASITLQLGAFGTAGSQVCARSRTVFASADLPGPGAGYRRQETDTRLLCDHGSAARVLEWRASAYALPHRRIECLAPEQEYGWLTIGSPVAVTRDELGLDEEVGYVERFDHQSDGLVGIGVVFIDTAARPGV